MAHEPPPLDIRPKLFQNLRRCVRRQLDTPVLHVIVYVATIGVIREPDTSRHSVANHFGVIESRFATVRVGHEYTRQSVHRAAFLAAFGHPEITRVLMEGYR